MTQAFTDVYTIVFKDLETYPDLTQNANLKERVRFVNKTERSYVVQSQINDTELKELLKRDYQLLDRQVSIQSNRGYNLQSLF